MSKLYFYSKKVLPQAILMIGLLVLYVWASIITHESLYIWMASITSICILAYGLYDIITYFKEE